MGDLLDHLHDNGIDPGMVVGERMISAQAI